MFLIDYVTPKEAQGEVKEVYSMFPSTVPDSVQLFSASPRYLLKQMATAGEYLSDETFSRELMAALRFIGASTACFNFCTEFNRQMLISMGLSEAEVESLATAPSGAFEEKDAVLIAFAAKSQADPESVTKNDVDMVREAGWSDQQIFEATAYTAQMATVGIIFRTFATQ